MNRPRYAIAMTLLFAAGGSAVSVLHGQAVQVRAKVSEALPRYQPAAQLKGVVPIPVTDALSDLGEEWQRSFQTFHPAGKLVFTPKLSKEAVQTLLDGASAVALTAREFLPEETKAFQTKYGYIPMRIPICLDANIVFVHKSNPISSITMEQLDAIYGKRLLGGAKEPIKVWGDLGVRGELAKRPINAYSRAEGTATRASFAALALLKGDFRPGIIDRDDSSSLAEAILTDAAGIAFGPMASWYAANKILPIVPYQGTEARYPTQEMVTSSRYPMPRLFYAYVNRAPGKPLDPEVNEFLHFILSREGQNAVADTGLLPGPVEFLTIAIKRLGR